MSHETLRDLLHEVAADHPPVRVDPRTYRRGRRAHWRRVVAAAVLGTVGVVAGTTAALPLLERSSQSSPAVGEDGAALPSRIYDVPERLAEHIGHAEGYRWHADLAARDLAVGTTAAVFPVNKGAVAAVSALDGGYRGLDLPGFDEIGFSRFGGPPVALSPDGNRLAYTWHPDVTEGGNTPGYEPSGVRIVDLSTGQVRSIRIRHGFGVYARGFSWSPDGRYLAYNLHVTTRDGSGGIRGTRNFRVGRLDTATWTHLTATGLTQAASGAPAVSNRGEVASVGVGRPKSWLPGRRPEVQSFEGGVDDWTAAWSPDGRRLATGSYRYGWFSVGNPRSHGLVTGTAADAPSGSSVRVVGWVDDERVALLHHDEDDADVVSVVPAWEPLGGPGRRLMDLEPTTGLGDLSVATGLLARPTRDFPEPGWPTDWLGVLTWSGIGLLALVIVGPPAYARRRTHSASQA